MDAPLYVLLGPTLYQLFWLVACLSAIGFALGFEATERKAAIICATVIMTNWLFGFWVAQPFAPQMFLGHIGLHFAGEDLWALSDCIAGVLFLSYGLPHRWAWLLWGVAVFQEVAHYFQGDFYLATLDALLSAQLLVFFLGGSRGVTRYILDGLSHSHSLFVNAQFNRLSVHLMHSANRPQSQSLAVPFVKCTTSAIRGLLTFSGPAHISRFVPSVVVNPVKAGRLWPRTNMREKSTKVVDPFRMHKNPTTSVMSIAGIVGIGATAFGGAPSHILAGVAHPVHEISDTFATAATFGTPAFYAAGSNNSNITAIASTFDLSSRESIRRKTLDNASQNRPFAVFIARLHGSLRNAVLGVCQGAVFFWGGRANVADYLHSSARWSSLRIRALSFEAFYKRRAR